MAKGVKETGADGLFVDRMHVNVWCHPGKRAEVAAAQAEMMRMAKAANGAEKILLLNNGAAIPALFAIGDAFMFEHYSPASISKEAIVNDWALMKKIAAAGKVVIWRIGVEHQLEESPLAEVAGESRQQREQRLEYLSQ